jgi:hypothetical protein
VWTFSLRHIKSQQMANRLRCCVAVLMAIPFCALATLADTRVHIREVGVGERYNPANSPTRASVVVTNLAAQPETIDLQINIVVNTARMKQLGYTIHSTVWVAGRETRVVDAPLVLPEAGYPELVVEAHGPDGALLASDRLSLNYSANTDRMTGLFCADHAVCERVQAELFPPDESSDEQKREARRSLLPLVDSSPPWWALSMVDEVIVAEPEAKLAAPQKEMLEAYLRSGGRVVLLEDELRRGEMLARLSFLGPYRSARPDGTPQRVGRGDLFDLPGITGMRKALNRPLANPPAAFTSFRSQVGTVFLFPGILWLVLWMGVYVLSLGVLNFWILHRIGRRELAWATMLAISLLFAAGLFAESTARRPAHYGLDDLVVYWMDDRSGQAYFERGVQVSSPRQDDIRLDVAGENVFTGSGILHNRQPVEGFGIWSQPVRLHAFSVGPPEEFELSFVPWSFATLRFEGTRGFPGTLHRSAAHLIRNDSGLAFTRAIYVTPLDVSYLGQMAPGAETDLERVRKVPLAVARGALRGEHTVQPLNEDLSPATANQSPAASASDPVASFRLASLVAGASDQKWFERASAIFVGLNESPGDESSVTGRPFIRRHYSIFIVSFGREP